MWPPNIGPIDCFKGKKFEKRQVQHFLPEAVKKTLMQEVPSLDPEEGASLPQEMVTERKPDGQVSLSQPYPRPSALLGFPTTFSLQQS